MLKWAGALGGAVVVGAAAGFGTDMLVRPNVVTTKTATTTTTTTPPPPATISYKPPLSPSVQAKVDQFIKDRIAVHDGETVVYASHGGCMGGADLSKVHIKNGVVVAIEPDDLVNPKTPREDATLSWADVLSGKIRGTPAQQQYSYPYWLRSPNRVLYPVKRVGARGDFDGQFVRITWDEALTTIANKVTDLKSKYGPYSIWARGFTLGPWVGMGLAHWGNASYGAEEFAWKMCFNEVGGPSPRINEIFDAKLIVLWPYDPTSASGTDARTYLWRLAREKGIPIIAIDPRYSMAAEVIADQWIPIRPTTDVAMQLAVANVLFKEALYDAAYVNKYVEPTGFAKWKDYVLGNTAGPDGKIDRTPEWAEGVCGVPAATIREFARLYAKSKPTFLMANCGLSRQFKGDNPVRGAVYLQAMTGNIGVAGGSPSGADSTMIGGLTGVSAPSISRVYGQVAGTFKAPVGMISYMWAQTVLLGQKYWNGEMTKEQYYAAIGNNISNPAPNFKMVWWGSQGFMVQHNNINNQIRAIKALELVVNSCTTWNPTAKVSDIVLPVCEFFEEPSFASIPRGFVYVPKLVDPPGETRALEWLNVQLANKLGVGDKYNPRMANVSWDQWYVEMEKVCQTAYETWAASDTAKALGIPIASWADFKKNPVVRVNNTASAIPFGDQISKGTAFKTTSGKIEFYNPYLETWDASKTLPDSSLGGPFAPMASYEVANRGFMDQKTATLPLLLMSNTHNRYRGHSFQDTNPYLRGDLYEHALWMSPADAKARNIQDGDLIHVHNELGEMVIPVNVTSRMTPGVVHMHDAAWYIPNKSGVDKSGCPNTLDSDDRNSCGEDPHNTLVEVEKF